MKCVLCKKELERTSYIFMGVDNYGEGKYIYFYFCGNKNCNRYKLYCGNDKISSSQKREREINDY